MGGEHRIVSQSTKSLAAFSAKSKSSGYFISSIVSKALRLGDKTRWPDQHTRQQAQVARDLQGPESRVVQDQHIRRKERVPPLLSAANCVFNSFPGKLATTCLIILSALICVRLGFHIYALCFLFFLFFFIVHVPNEGNASLS